MSKGERWKGRLGEAAMIVVSILLAFWIDAWWSGLREAQDERESLELVSRDLNAAIVQLTEFAEFTEKIGTEDEGPLEHDEGGASNRKRVALPTAAFEYGPDYFWSLPTNSVEWHRLRSSLSVTAHTLFMGREYALEIIEDARTLDAEIRRELDAR